MLKIYIGNVLENIPYLEILYPNLGKQKREDIFPGKGVFEGLLEPLFSVVEKAEEADYLLIPHNYLFIEDKEEYISSFTKLSSKHNKKIITIFQGDSDKAVKIPNALILRMSQYRYKKASNEIIMPAYAKDLSDGQQILYRKKSSKSIVGFCGWADFISAQHRTKFYIKNGLLNMKQVIYKNSVVHKQGIYFRKKALKVLSQSNLVKTNFIIRKFHSASKKTIKIDPETAQKEYVENMKESDFILAPKGDGNFSVRFYEALSMGRIPILIDTETELPLENIIPYNEFILKVSYKDVNRLDSIVYDFYRNLSDEDFKNMQKKARDMFEKYLNPISFYKFIFGGSGPLYGRKKDE